mmetsp:Transcript_58692/g.104384  ORF Transcript_58692/g.104384 Transcript_58692/m.104384 type:complete len:217 (+) Transcript_58692:615-1265(+)
MALAFRISLAPLALLIHAANSSKSTSPSPLLSKSAQIFLHSSFVKAPNIFKVLSSSAMEREPSPSLSYLANTSLILASRASPVCFRRDRVTASVPSPPSFNQSRNSLAETLPSPPLSISETSAPTCRLSKSVSSVFSSLASSSRSKTPSPLWSKRSKISLTFGPRGSVSRIVCLGARDRRLNEGLLAELLLADIPRTGEAQCLSSRHGARERKQLD